MAKILKEIVFDQRAQEEMQVLSQKTTKKFGFYIDILARGGFLRYPNSSKITAEISEIRVNLDGKWRLFYSYYLKSIIFLHLIRKKSQKTPLKAIQTARFRLNEYKKYYGTKK